MKRKIEAALDRDESESMALKQITTSPKVSPWTSLNEVKKFILRARLKEHDDYQQNIKGLKLKGIKEKYFPLLYIFEAFYGSY